jgi:geranylgeranyl pyrophosphate synthase
MNGNSPGKTPETKADRVSSGNIPSDFKSFIAMHRPMVYSKICEYVPLKEPVGHYGIMRDYIDRQGSYRRPGLVMLSGMFFGAKTEDLLLPAAAEQLSEDWILMQDDAEDDSELRRGKVTAHRLYGWVHAINATNAGQMAMWCMLKDYVKQVGMEKGDRMYEKFYDMLAYTMEGQYIENKFIQDTKDIKQANEALYFRIVDSKTCYYTVYGPLQIGAIAANQPDNILEALKEIGTYAGIAFQITDDILDLVGDEKVTGKKPLGDLYEGKITLIALHAYKNATPEEKARMEEIYKKKRVDKTEEEILFLKGLIDKYKSAEYAQSMTMDYGRKAREAIEHYKELFPKNGFTPLMISAMEEQYIRKK